MDARTTTSPQQIRWASGLNIILGLWLIIAPFVLDYAMFGVAVWNDIIIGILIAVCAAIRVSGAFSQPGWSWFNVLLGVWLILAPFVLAYPVQLVSARWNDIIVGILAIVLGWTSASATTTTTRTTTTTTRPPEV